MIYTLGKTAETPHSVLEMEISIRNSHREPYSILQSIETYDKDTICDKGIASVFLEGSATVHLRTW